jgi:hypothetical protein
MNGLLDVAETADLRLAGLGVADPEAPSPVGMPGIATADTTAC